MSEWTEVVPISGRWAGQKCLLSMEGSPQGGLLYPLTPCCGAAVKGCADSSTGCVCKKCWEDVPIEYGGAYEYEQDPAEQVTNADGFPTGAKQAERLSPEQEDMYAEMDYDYNKEESA